MDDPRTPLNMGSLLIFLMVVNMSSESTGTTLKMRKFENKICEHSLMFLTLFS